MTRHCVCWPMCSSGVDNNLPDVRVIVADGEDNEDVSIKVGGIVE